MLIYTAYLPTWASYSIAHINRSVLSLPYVRMSVCYQDVEEEVMYGIEAICPEEGKVLDRVCRISENEAEVQKLSEMMNQNELSLRHFRCVVDDFRH